LPKISTCGWQIRIRIRIRKLYFKSGECYTNMFRHLIEVARDFGHNFQLSSIHLDFENAVFEVARVFWPTVIIKGCHFHLSQAT
jgi:hypothetical protein